MAANNNDPNKTNNDQFSNNSNYINPYYNSIRNAEQNTDIDYIRQFLIYYSLGKMFLRPAGIFSGQIINEYLTTIPYILRRSNGEIRWIPYDPDNAMMQNDYHYVMETNVAPSDTANVTVVARNKAKVYVYGEIYRGFSFEADSTLELHGILYIGHWTQDGLTEEYVNRNSIIEAHEGNVVIFLCDYKEIVVLRDGNSKYMIKLTNDDKEKSKSKSHAQAKGGVIQFDPPKPINNQGQQQAGQQQSAQPGQQAQQQQQQAQQPSPIEMIVEKSVSRSKRVKSETQATQAAPPPPPPQPQVEVAQPPPPAPVQQEEPPLPPPPTAPPPTPPEPQPQPQQQQILTSTFYQDPFAQQDSQIPSTSVPSSQITESQSTTPSQPISQSESTAAAPPVPAAAPPPPTPAAAPPPPTPAPAPPPPAHKSTSSKFPPQYTNRGGFDDFGWNASQLFQSAHKSQTGSGGASTTATGPTKSGSTTITIKVAKSIEVVSDDKTIEALRQLSSKALQQRSQQSTQTPGSNASSGSGVTVNKSKVATMKTKYAKGKRSLAQKSSKMTGKKPKGSKPANMKMSQSKFVGSKRTVDGGGGGTQPTPSSESPKNHVVKAKKSQVGKQKIRKSKSTFMPKKPGSKSKFGIKQPPPQGHRKLSFASSGGGFKGGKSRSAIQQRPKSQLQDSVPKSNAAYVDSMQIEVTDDQQVVTIAPTPAPPPTFDQSPEQPLTDYSGQQQQHGMQDPGTSGIPAIAVYQQTVQTYEAKAPAADQPPPGEQTQLKDNMVVINGPGGGGSPPPPPTDNQGQGQIGAKDQTLLIKTEGGLTYEIPLTANTGTTITAITTTEVPLGPKEPPQPKGKQSKFGKIVKAKTPKTPKKSIGPKSPKPKTKSSAATGKTGAAKSPRPVAKRKISQQLKKRPSVTTVKVSKSKFSLGTNKGKSPGPQQYDHQQQQMAAHKSKTSATKSMFKVTTTGTVKIKRKATMPKEKTHLNKLKAKMEISQLMRDMSASHSRLTMSKLERTRSATAAPDPDDQANFDKNLNEEVEQLKEKMAQVVVILRQLVDTISEGPEQDELNRDLKELESYADKLSPEQFERLSGKIVSIANRIDEITGM